MRTISAISATVNASARALTARHDRPGRLVIAASLVLAVAVMLPTPVAYAQSVRAKTAATPEGRPPDWEQTKAQMRDLTFAGEDAKVIAIAERIVAAHPRFADGHARLGGAHENLARSLIRTDPARAGKHFELAAGHLRHAFDLGGGEYPDATIRGLIDLYEYALPEPATWRATVREALARYPAEPAAHWYGIQLVLREGGLNDLEASFRTARAALPPAADPRLEYASLLVGLAERNSNPGVRAALAREALAVADAVVKKSPADRIVREKADAIREDVARLKLK